MRLQPYPSLFVDSFFLWIISRSSTSLISSRIMSEYILVVLFWSSAHINSISVIVKKLSTLDVLCLNFSLNSCISRSNSTIFMSCESQSILSKLKSFRDFCVRLSRKGSIVNTTYLSMIRRLQAPKSHRTRFGLELSLIKLSPGGWRCKIGLAVALDYVSKDFL